MPNISTLAGQADQLQTSVDRWTNAAIGLAVVAAILGILAGAAQWHRARQAKRLAAVQADIVKAKDNQFALDLKDKDIQIQATKQKQSETDLEIAGAKQKQAEAELKVERLRALQMPRWIDEKPFLAALKDQPKPSLVLISFAEDDESERLAHEFMGLLYQAGWPVRMPIPLERAPNSPAFVSAAESLGGQTSGLSFVSRDPIHMPLLVWQEGFKPATPFEALWLALTKARYPAFHPAQDPALPAGSIRIIVGTKPAFVIP